MHHINTYDIMKDYQVNEINKHLKLIIDKVKEENRKYGIPELTKNNLCKSDAEYLATYPNGDQNLIKMSITTGKFSIIKKIK